MKHIFFKISNISKGIALSAFLTLVSLSSSAKTNKTHIESFSKISPEVTYAGTDKSGSPFYLVSFETAVPVRFEVTLTDEYGVEFFAREFESSQFSKRFKLVNERAENDMNLTISIRLLPSGETHSFMVENSFERLNTVSIKKNN